MSSSRKAAATAPKSSKGVKNYWCPHEGKIWAVGEFQSEDKAKRTVKLAVKEDKTVADYPIDSCILIEDNSIITEDVDDLVSLSQVNDATILNCSRIRFDKSVIYTSIGAVLMAVNPFERIEGLYGRANIAKYHWDSRDTSLSPHIYLTPAGAYKAMASFGKNQSLIISGESGAGKTEATKQCLDYLTKVSTGHSSSSSSISSSGGEGDEDISDIAHRIIAASPILEAFGNAQTVRNPNSSRFGKWMELSFNSRNEIMGSRIISYLLEKSRVTQHDPKERNYHLFYQIVRGADAELLTTLRLKNSSTHYKYLCKGLEQEAKDFQDAANFKEMMEAFHIMGFDAEATVSTLKLVAAVLLLGNVAFESINDDEASRVDETDAESMECFHAAAELVGVETVALGMAMSTRTIQSGGLRKSITTVRLNKQKASDTRDSLARCIYDKLFLDVIKKINANSEANDVGSASGATPKLIGLLDIFGFEIFELNSFEQLCINYCNEMLQNHFTFVIFVAELKMYEDENISCDSIEFKDNANIIQLIEGSFKSLDEESKIPRGSSKTWFDKLKNANNSNSLDKKKASSTEAAGEILVKFPPGHDAFIVSHYAGPVSYIPENFMEKNTEIISNDLVNAMMLSKIDLVKEMFTPDPQPVSDSPARSGRGKGGGKSTTASLSKSFQNQLQSLMTLLGSTESHFVKCIKSSSRCRPKDFEASLIHRQLLYSGVFEVVKIQQSGLPSRLTNDVFNNRYRCILPVKKRWDDLYKEGQVSIVDGLRELNAENLTMIQVGRTMTFMKGKELRCLENWKEDVEVKAAFVIQNWTLGCKLRQLYLTIRKLRLGIDQNITNLQLDSAEKSVALLQDNIDLFSLLTHSKSLVYLVDKSRELVVTLKLQLQILATIDTVLSSHGETILTEETCQTLNVAVSDALSIQFEHSSVTSAQDATKKYLDAKEAIIQIEALSLSLNKSSHKKSRKPDSDDESDAESNNDSENDRNDDDKSHLEEDPGNENELSSTQLTNILQSLGPYSNVLSGAAEALSVAKQKLNEIQVEMNYFVPQLKEGLHRERLRLDLATGQVVLEDVLASSNPSPLTAALTDIDPKKLKGKDCKILYKGCAVFLDIKSVALEGNAQATVDRIESFRNNTMITLVKPGEATPDYFQDLDRQFSMLLEWASDKLMFDEIASVLVQEYVVLPPEKQQQELQVNVEGLQQMNLRHMQGNQALSSLTSAWVNFCIEVLRMRELYNEKKWTELNAFLSDEYVPQVSRMEESAAGSAAQLDVLRLLREEQQNCHDIASFYLLFDELKAASTTAAFSLVNVDCIHTSIAEVLQHSVNVQTEVIARAKLVEKTYTPDFSLLVELMDFSTQLRLSVIEGRFGESNELVKTLRTHKVIEIIPKYNVELDYCLELLNILDKEAALKNSLKTIQISWTVFRNETLQFSSIHITCATNAEADISNLESSCEEVKQLPRCPQQLLQQAKTAQQYLVEARKLSYAIQQEDAFTGGPTMLPCLVGATTTGRSTRHELATVNNLKACIDFFQMAISNLCTILFPENVTEIKRLLLELQRRYLAYQFNDVLTTHRSISGQVGSIVVDKDSSSASVKLFADISGALNSFRSVVKSSEAAVLTSSEVQKLHPSDQPRGFPTLFLNHLDPMISISERLITIREAVCRDDWKEIQLILDDIEEQKVILSSQKTTGNSSYLNGVFQSLMLESEEITLVQTENDHNRLIRSLRDAVENLQVDFFYNPAQVLKFNPDPKTVELSKLEAVRSQAAVVGCHSNESTQLLDIVYSLIAMLTKLKEGKRDDISHDDMLRVHETITTKMMLSGSQLFAILHYVKMSQVIKQLYETAINTSDYETKALYMATQAFTSRKTTKTNSNISPELRRDLQPWVRRLEALRQLRLLRSSEDWLGVVDLVNSSIFSSADEEEGEDGVSSDADKDDVQFAFLHYLKTQKEEAYQQAKAHEVAAQFAIASSTGMVGSKGVTSFYIPERGIDMLRGMLQKTTADSEHYELLPEALAQQEQLASLLVLRESALREAATSEVEKLKVNKEPTLNKQSPSILAARAKTSDAISKSTDFFVDECKFVSETSNLLQLVENIEFAILKPAVIWERSPVDTLYKHSSPGKESSRVRLNSFDQTNNFLDEGQVEINVENVELQKKAVIQIQSTFPDKCQELPLVTITNSLHEILSTAEHVSDYSALEDKLRSFSILLQVLDVPEHVKVCLENQVLVFQKGHMLDQMSSLITEGSDLLSSHCYNKAIFDDYVDKITFLTISAGEKSLPEDISSCIKCMRCCRDLLLASDFLLSAEFAKQRKELDVASAQAPEWFYDLLGRWVGKLHDPSVSTAGFLADAERTALSRQESVVSYLSPSAVAMEREGTTSVATLCLQEIGQYIQHMVKVKSNATGLSQEVIEDKFNALHQPFNVWKERYNLVNLAWKGFQCFEESLSVSELHFQSFSHVLHAPCTPVFHVDTYSLSLVCSLLKAALEKEVNDKFAKVMSEMEQTFTNIVNLFEAYMFPGKAKEQQREKEGKKSKEREPIIYNFLDSREQQQQIEQTGAFSMSLARGLASVRSALSVLEEVAGLRLTKKLKDTASSLSSSNSKAYFDLSAQVKTKQQVVFTMYSSAKDWHLDVECCPRFALQLSCSGENNTSKKKKYAQSMLAELFLEVASRSDEISSLTSSVPTLKFSYHSPTTDTSYLIQVANVATNGSMTIIFCDPLTNEKVTVSCSSKIFFACLDDSAFLVNMMCVCLDELRKAWKDVADPSLSALIQDALGPHNVSSGNTSLQLLISRAREAIDQHLSRLEYNSRLLLASYSGYNLFLYSPWHFQWIDHFIAEKNMQLVYVNMPKAVSIGISSHAMLTHMLKSHEYLKSNVEALCGSTHVFQDNVMNMLIAENSFIQTGHSTADAALSDGDKEMNTWLCSSDDAPVDAMWKLNKKVALCSIARQYPSQGVLREFVGLVQDLVASVTPPACLAFFPSNESANNDMYKEGNVASIHARIQAFIERVSTSVMHPLVNFVILCTQELHFISLILQKVQDASSNQEDSINALEMLAQGSYFVESFGGNLCTLVENFREACVGNDKYKVSLDLITALEISFEELVCKMEGLCRLKLVHEVFVNAAVNRKNTMLENSLDKSKTTAGGGVGSLVNTSAIAVIQKTLSFAFKYTKISSSDNSAQGQKTFLKPLVPQSWLESLEAEGQALDNLFRLRSLTSSWRVNGDEGDVVATTAEQTQERGGSQQLKDEEELLVALSAVIVQMPNINLRSHLLKELGVVSLRNLKLDLDDKIGEIILLVKLCGCDIRALQLGLHMRGLFDVPDPNGRDGDDDNASVGSAEEVVLGGGLGSADVNNVSVQTASHYISFLDILDSICNCFLSPKDISVDSTERVPALSRGELGKRVGMLYLNANSLGALGRPTNDLAPPKITAKPVLNKSSSLVESTAANSSASAPSLPSSTASTGAVVSVSPVHLLATRLMFMGYLKSHLEEILQKIDSGSMNPLGRLKDSKHMDSLAKELTSEESNSGGKQEHDQQQGGEMESSTQDAIPPVPLSADAFNWLSYDEDSVPTPKEVKSRRSSSAARVRTATSNPNYSIAGLKTFYLEFKSLFNLFLSVRCEFYQNVGISNIAKSIAFLNELDDFSAKYFIVELEELMQSYKVAAEHKGVEVSTITEGEDEGGSRESSPVKVKEGEESRDHDHNDIAPDDLLERSSDSCDSGRMLGDHVDAKVTLDSILDARPTSASRVILSTRTVLTHLCGHKAFNSLMSSDMSADLRVMSFLCMPEWVCTRQDMLSACHRMKQEVKYALQTSMVNEYHKNLMLTLGKHNQIFEEVVYASFSGRAESKGLLATSETWSGGLGGGDDEQSDQDTSGHNLLHLWFCHRFDKAAINNGIPMDAIIFEFLREDVFDSEEAARSFFEALDANGNGYLTFREIMDRALSNTFEEKYFLEKFIAKLRRRNSLRRSVSAPLTAEDEEEAEKEETERQNREKKRKQRGDGNDDDDIHYIHEAFLQYYFKTVMVDNLYLDNLVKAVPHLDDDEPLPPATAELLQRAKLIMKIRTTANAGFFFSHDEHYSVEEFLDEWFDTIPDPDAHAGSSEIKAVYIATKNKVVRKMFDSKIKSELEKREGLTASSNASLFPQVTVKDEEIDDDKDEEYNDEDNDDYIFEDKEEEVEVDTGDKDDKEMSFELNHEESIRVYDRALTNQSFSTKDIQSTLNSFFMGKEFACSQSSLTSMRETALINDLLITKECDIWEGLGELHDITFAPLSSDTPSIAHLFEEFLHEFHCRNYFRAATEELHHRGQVNLSLLHPPMDVDELDDVNLDDETDDRDGADKHDDSNDDKDSDDDNNSESSSNADDKVNASAFAGEAAAQSREKQETGTKKAQSRGQSSHLARVYSAVPLADEYMRGGGLMIRIALPPNASISSPSSCGSRNVTLPAPTLTSGPLILAVFDLISQSAEKNNRFVDKRLVLLYQFLDFQLSKRRYVDGVDSKNNDAVAAPAMSFKDILKVSEWIQLTSSEWSTLFPLTYGTCNGSIITARSLRQPVSLLKTTITLERRRFIQLWQHDLFHSVCKAVLSDTTIIIPHQNKKEYYDGDEDAKAAAIRMAEFSDFNLVDVGKSTTIRTVELNEVLAANLKKLLTPFAALYCIFATNQFKGLYAGMSQSAIDRLNFIFSSDPEDRFIQESLRVFNWILAGLPRDDEEGEEEVESFQEGGEEEEEEEEEHEVMETEVTQDGANKKEMSGQTSEEVGYVTPLVGTASPVPEAAPAPPTPLELISIAMQCSIPPAIKQHLLFCRLQCVNAVNKKFLIKELRKAADGGLKEHMGRQQVFTDMSKAFTELSFILVEMENKDNADILFDDEENENENGEDDDDDVHTRSDVNTLSPSGISESDESDDESEEREERWHHTPRPLLSRISTAARRTIRPSKRLSISNTMKEFKNTTSELVKAGHWILRLEMSILTEDWDAMEAIISEHKTNPITVKECPDAISSFISLACDIRAHNECLDKMERYLYYSAPKQDKKEGGGGLCPPSQRKSVAGAIAAHDSRPFFYFVNFLALEPLVKEINSNIHLHVKSFELEEKLEVCEFLIKVKTAIKAEKWFENEAQNEKFVADMHVARPPEVLPTAHMSEVARRIYQLEMELNEKEQKKKDLETYKNVTCVSTLLKKERPENLPRMIGTEIQRIEREFQNQQVEICLVEALSLGQEYLKNNDLALIQVADLEEVCDIASGMTQRSQRTTLLFDSAQKVMNLRRCLKAADWGGVRCWLSEPSDVAPEAFKEIDAIEKLSDINLEMHALLANAMQNNCVSGTYMKLDTSNTNISMLLVAIRNSAHVPKLSPEDRQICYTAECIKSIRLSILMSDYDTLIAEIMAVDVKDISTCALDEFLLVKKSISFYECMNKLRSFLGSNGPKGIIGSIDAQNISIYRLGSAINAIDYNICSPSIQLYLNHATVMKNIRSAFKGGRFGISSLVECLVLECIEKAQREKISDVPPQLEHTARYIRKMTYGREILGGVYINDSAMNELTLDRIQDDMEVNEHGIMALLQVGMSNRSEQWKKRVYKDDDNITAVKTPYEDIPTREFYLSTLVTSTLLRKKDPDSVAAQLGQLPTHVLSESEEEILLVRDELYNRIALNVLNRGLLRTESTNKHEKTRFKGMDVDMSPIQIEHAISIVQHLGVKTEAVMKLYHTALVIKKMRFYSRDIHKSDKCLNKVVEALGQIKSLKSNNLFAAIATSEIEYVFNMVCSKTIRQELTNALDECLPRIDSAICSKQRQPFTTITFDNDGDSGRSKDLQKITILRKALRASAVNGGELRDADTKILRDMCDVLHKVMAATNSGIHSRMIASHDYAERLASTVEAKLKEGERMRTLDSLFNSNRRSADEINEVDLPSLSKRMTKEIAHQRRNMMEIRYTSASSSSTLSLHSAHMRRSSGVDLTWTGTRAKSASIDNSNLDLDMDLGAGVGVGTDFSAMNSLQLYEATGETTTTSLIEKGKLIATQTQGRDGEAPATSFFPPYFHGSKAQTSQYMNYAEEAALQHDQKAVELIRGVVSAHAAALKPSQFYVSPQQLKQEKHKMNSFVRVALNGNFKVHLETISKNPIENFSAVQRIAATFLLTLVKFPKDVKLTTESESTVAISRKLLESASQLLARNEEASFISGASVRPDLPTESPSALKPTRRQSFASSWRTSEESNLHGYLEKKSEIRHKSQQSFATAIHIGEFVELAMIQITSNFSTRTADQRLTNNRLSFLENYFKNELTHFLVPSAPTTPISGLSEPKREAQSLTAHPIYSLVLNKIIAAKESNNNTHTFA